MVYLGKILGSETKIKILSVLVTNPRSSYMERELAKEGRSSVSEVNRQIEGLVNSGLITMQRLGKTKLYSINQKHFLFSPLKKLLVDLNKIYKRIAWEIRNFALKKIRHIQAVILIGSVAKADIREDIVREPSDIDLVFILKQDKDIKEAKKILLDYISRKISLRYGISLYPFVISRAEYLNRLSARDTFILESYTKGEVLYGEKPRRFSQVGNK
jgi:DNA-binding transcriptional ArsR family regulator